MEALPLGERKAVAERVGDARRREMPAFTKGGLLQDSVAIYEPKSSPCVIASCQSMSAHDVQENDIIRSQIVD